MTASKQWTPAKDIPVEWEGRDAWEYAGPNSRVRMSVIPFGFSREPHHCGKWCFMPVEKPEPPVGDKS